MLQVTNRTPFEVGLLLLPDERGADSLIVVIKATFDIDAPQLRVADRQRSLVYSDEHWGDPSESSLKYANEAHLPKPGTDVVLVGSAHAPSDRPIPACHVSVVVGSLRKSIAVFGDRTWVRGAARPRPSAPMPFTELPLTYERAFGGTVLDGDKVWSEPRNPVGRGLRGGRSQRDMLGVALPNLEDPGAQIRDVDDAPAPCCGGFVAPSWLPRRAFAGTYDATWSRERAPFLPEDFQWRFFSVASPGLWAERGLVGGEPVELHNISPDGERKFSLPRCEFIVVAHEARRVWDVPTALETVLLEPSMGSLSMTWRGLLRCDKRALKISRVCIDLRSLLGARSAA